MCTVLLPPVVNPIAVNKYISYRIIYHIIIYHIISSYIIYIILPTEACRPVILSNADLLLSYHHIIRGNLSEDHIINCTLTHAPLTLYNPIFLPTACPPALICFGQERGSWITCNYPTVLKEKNMEKQKEYNLHYLLAKVRTT
jgi:hypothetical protein